MENTRRKSSTEVETLPVVLPQLPAMHSPAWDKLLKQENKGADLCAQLRARFPGKA